MMKTYFSTIISLFTAIGAFAQVPVITNLSGANVACSFPAPAATYTASASNNPTSYSWSVLPAGVVTSSGNIASVNFMGSSGTFTVYCSASNSSGSGSPSSFVVTLFETPTVTFSGNTNIFCQGSSTNLQASPTVFSGSSTISYSWAPSTGLNTTTGNAVVASPPVSTNYTVHLLMGMCKNTANVFVNVNPLLINITPPASTVCAGSSIDLYASGSTSYTWSTGTTGSKINVLPPVTFSYTVTAIDTNGCLGSKVAVVNVDNTCSDVWPGDANSDGVVDLFDVLELGYNFLGTGPARSVTGNNYLAHHASNWSGTISTGKNKAHADCNGDGLVDLADTLAIYNNFALTHAFRSSAGGEAISLSSEYSNMAAPGQWGVLDIMVGEETSPVDIYGLVFDINYDNTMIEDAYVKFTPSFLNANNQNVEFRKTVHSAGKIHAAAIRTNGMDVNSSGKIGEFYFKIKQDIPEGVVVNTSVSNTQKAKHDHSLAPLTGNQLPLSVNKNPVAVSKNNAFSLSMYPNPAAERLTINSNSGETLSYSILDITGRVVMNGSFVKSTEIDTSPLSAGSYNIRFNSSSLSSTRKLLIK